MLDLTCVVSIQSRIEELESEIRRLRSEDFVNNCAEIALKKQMIHNLRSQGQKLAVRQ